MKRRLARAAVIGSCLFGAGSAVSFGNGNTAAPTPLPITDKFTGTIAPLGTDSHNFTVVYSGYSDASFTITSLTTVADGTTPAISIGVGFGTTNVGVCTRSAGFTNPSAPLATELSTTGTPFTPGVFCIQVFDNPDSPTVTEPLNYAITVKHY